jgi:hypothetical protein
MQFLLIIQYFGTFKRSSAINERFIIEFHNEFHNDPSVIIDRKNNFEYRLSNGVWVQHPSPNWHGGWKAQIQEFEILSYEVLTTPKFKEGILRLDIREVAKINRYNSESIIRYEFMSIENSLIDKFVICNYEAMEQRSHLTLNSFVYRSEYPYLFRKVIMEKNIEIHELVSTSLFEVGFITNSLFNEMEFMN